VTVLSSSASFPKYAVRKQSGGHYDEQVRVLKRIAVAFGLLFGGLLYVWFAGVRAVPAVKRRKAALRAGASRRRR
jgi:hypothetical protein